MGLEHQNETEDATWNKNYDQWIKEKIEGATTAIRAIRAKCLDCVAGSSNLVKECEADDWCPLWKFRLGKNPNIKKRELTEDQREALRSKGRELARRYCPSVKKTLKSEGKVP